MKHVMKGIVFMKQKYKEEGMSFKCFHNRVTQKDGLLGVLAIHCSREGGSIV